MKRLPYSTAGACLRTFLLVALSASAALAQIGGPKDMKPAADKNAPADAPKTASGRFEKEGVRIEFSAKPADPNGALVAGQDALVTFSVSDARTGQPLAGVRPSAWISTRKADTSPSEEECKDKIRTFMGGLLSARPDVDLNSYLLLTLNHDNTISVINPLVSFSRTQLENLITLPGPGADWALSPSGETLYVTLPEQSAVAVVSTVTRKVLTTIPVGDKARPMRVAFEPGGARLWVGLDNSPAVAVIDAATNKLAATVEAGAGLHQIAFTDDGRFAYVTNSGADTVTAVDAKALKKIADIPVGKTPVPVAYSAASRRVYVASVNAEAVSVIDPARQQVVRTVPVKRGTVALRFDPTGRFGFAVNQVNSEVAVIDASTEQVAGTVTVAKSPDQVVFTDRYAYVRATGSEKFSLVELGGIQKGKFAAVDVTAGQKPASDLPAEIGVADMIATTPEGNAAMVANTADAMVYYYVEGMMAPMGTLSNYKRRPHAALVLNRSLTETAPGVYTVPVRLKKGGRFDVSVLTGQPRISHCFQMEVASTPEDEKANAGASVAVRALFDGRKFKAGEAGALRFRVTDSATGQPLKGLADVQVLAFEPPGIWQQRQMAREVGEGEYEITQTFPRPGLYKVMLRVASRGVTFADLPATLVPVVSGADSIEKAN
ncbi:MAG TPA: FixH family protein [Pyrinomonadaceae bacterium]|jgi:YVTN family beta-propeller protein|nr:FixH family protein [Pyrinomonadaceae bacterium]